MSSTSSAEVPVESSVACAEASVARPAFTPLPCGSTIVLQGLKNKPEKNGIEAVVVAFSDGKYQVQFASGGTTKVKPENAQLAPSKACLPAQPPMPSFAASPAPAEVPPPPPPPPPPAPPPGMWYEPEQASQPAKSAAATAEVASLSALLGRAPQQTAAKGASAAAEIASQSALLGPVPQQAGAVSATLVSPQHGIGVLASSFAFTSPAATAATSPAVAHGAGAALPCIRQGAVAAPPAAARACSAPPDVVGHTPGREKGTGRGKGKGKGGDSGREFRISMAMTKILRHSAASFGISVRPDGFCRVEDVLGASTLRNLGATQQDLMQAVQNCEKKRFDLSQESGDLLIRASQGHSMKVVSDEQLLTPLNAQQPDLPCVCVHGTYRKHLQSILQQGLLAGGGTSARNHVHFAPYEPGSSRVISGMRASCDIAIYLDLRRAILAGIPFYRSTNQVLLTPGLNKVVPPNYFQGVKDLHSGQWIRGPQ